MESLLEWLSSLQWNRLIPELLGTTLHDPVPRTEGTLGFEVLNDAAGHLAGLLATTPFDRETWLFAMTCEDRQLVRKKCIRCFLVRPEDLDRFSNWQWCATMVRVESPWHWFRVVALHRIAVKWSKQQETDHGRKATDMPLVDSQVQHDRIRRLSLGINLNEKPIGDPHVIDWSVHQDELTKLGMNLPQIDAETDAVVSAD